MQSKFIAYETNCYKEFFKELNVLMAKNIDEINKDLEETIFAKITRKSQKKALEDIKCFCKPEEASEITIEQLREVFKKIKEKIGNFKTIRASTINIFQKKILKMICFYEKNINLKCSLSVSQPHAPFLNVPLEIKEEIYQYLGEKELIQLGRTCRFFTAAPIFRYHQIKFLKAKHPYLNPLISLNPVTARYSSKLPLEIMAFNNNNLLASIFNEKIIEMGGKQSKKAQVIEFPLTISSKNSSLKLHFPMVQTHDISYTQVDFYKSCQVLIIPVQLPEQGEYFDKYLETIKRATEESRIIATYLLISEASLIQEENINQLREMLRTAENMGYNGAGVIDFSDSLKIKSFLETLFTQLCKKTVEPMLLLDELPSQNNTNRSTLR